MSFNTWIQHLFFRGYSIKRRLPVLICVLLLGTTIIFSFISYYGVKREVMRSGGERLNGLWKQLSTMFGQSGQAMTTMAKSAAIQDTLKMYLRDQSEVNSDRAVRALEKLRQDTFVVLMELVNSEDLPVLQFSKNKDPDSVQKTIE